jgi:hypothetical protein
MPGPETSLPGLSPQGGMNASMPFPNGSGMDAMNLTGMSSMPGMPSVQGPAQGMGSLNLGGPGMPSHGMVPGSNNMMGNLSQPGQGFPGNNAPGSGLGAGGMGSGGLPGAAGAGDGSMMPPVTITSSNPLGKTKSGSSWWNPLSWSMGGWLVALGALLAGVMARRYFSPAQKATEEIAKEIAPAITAKANGTGFSFSETKA